MFSLLPAIYFQPEILQYWTHQPTKQKAEYHLFAAKLDYESNSFRNIKAPLSLWTLSFALSPIFATKKCFFSRYKSLLFAKVKAPLMKLRARADWKRNIKFRREGLLLPPPSNIEPYHHISAIFNFLVAISNKMCTSSTSKQLQFLIGSFCCCCFLVPPWNTEILTRV